MSLSEPLNQADTDQSYFERNMPEFLQESLEAMKEAWAKLDRGEEYLRWDCDFCDLQSDINSAEVDLLISKEQAWYLREKYLRIARYDPFLMEE